MQNCQNHKFKCENVEIMNFGTDSQNHQFLVQFCQNMNLWYKNVKKVNLKIMNLGLKCQNQEFLVQNYQNIEFWCKNVKIMN